MLHFVLQIDVKLQVRSKPLIMAKAGLNGIMIKAALYKQLDLDP